MDPREPHFTSARLEELTQPECLELLASKKVGRVAWCGARGPQVLPANYVVVDGDIILLTSGTSQIEKALYETRTAFQVDDIDDFLEAGWSVLVVGSATFVRDAEKRHMSSGELPETWAPGRRDVCIRIRPDEITGRRLHP
jgi:nitroimidazol reductase NimA-like FMN-containing flavoprotein (pyridoxamine 5'-phosphate oxidase superfamily)